jgi:hypothetical protein
MFVCYRDVDVQPRSCAGGTRLSKQSLRDEPGLYFEGEDGEWKYSTCNDAYRDAAFLMFTYYPQMEQVELACGGFSTESTAALAACLDQVLTGIKPQFVTPNLQMGMYIVEFTFTQSKYGRELLNGKEGIELKLLPVAPSAIERRLSPEKSPAPKRRPSTTKGAAPAGKRRAPRARPK